MAKSGRSARRSQRKRKAMLPVSPRIVTLDIETAPLKSYHWMLFDQNISLDQIQEEWSILAFCAKWLHEKQPIYKDAGGRGKGKCRDDRSLLTDLWTILDRADIVVTQNGQAFDIKKINARLVMEGFKPYAPIKIVDTKLIAKRHFAFTSNRLKWLAEFLSDTKKDDHKKFPGFELWEQCLLDNPKAWAEMRKYNIKDVLATEKVYLKLRPWMVGHPNVAVYSSMEEMLCPKCGSANVRKKGLWFTQSGEYQKIHCMNCGGWSRTRYTHNTWEKRQTLLSQ
jgi:hypothetical protein